MIVIARAEKSALGNANIAANFDTFQIQEPAFLAYPDVVSNLEFPRERNLHLWFNRHPPADARTKSAEHRSLQRGQAKWAKSKEK